MRPENRLASMFLSIPPSAIDARRGGAGAATRSLPRAYATGRDPGVAFDGRTKGARGRAPCGRTDEAGLGDIQPKRDEAVPVPRDAREEARSLAMACVEERPGRPVGLPIEESPDANSEDCNDVTRGIGAMSFDASAVAPVPYGGGAPGPAGAVSGIAALSRPDVSPYRFAACPPPARRRGLRRMRIAALGRGTRGRR
jgi:hypothetical protein